MPVFWPHTDLLMLQCHRRKNKALQGCAQLLPCAKATRYACWQPSGSRRTPEALKDSFKACSH